MYQGRRRFWGDRRTWVSCARWRLLAGALVFVVRSRAGFATDADDLIHQGVELRRSGQDEEALRAFERAYGTVKSPRAAAQMGLAEQALGKWVEAHGHLQEALRAKDDPWISKNRPALAEAASRVADHVGWIEIVGGSANVEVRLDGIPRGNLPLSHPLPTTTGNVSIELVLAGRAPLQRTTVVRGREVTRESFDIPATPSGPSRSLVSPNRPAAVTRTLPAPPSTVVLVDNNSLAQGSQSDEGEPLKDAEAGPAHRARSTQMELPGRTLIVASSATLAASALVFAAVEHRAWYGKLDEFDSASLGCDPHVSGYGSSQCSTLHDAGTRAKTLAFLGYGAAGVFAAASIFVLLFTVDSPPAEPKVALSIDPFQAGATCRVQF